MAVARSAPITFVDEGAPCKLRVTLAGPAVEREAHEATTDVWVQWSRCVRAYSHELVWIGPSSQSEVYVRRQGQSTPVCVPSFGLPACKTGMRFDRR